MQVHADTIYNGISDNIPMVIFIAAYLVVNIAVCLYIQWDVTLLMCSVIPMLIMSRIMFSKWFSKTMDQEVALQNKISNLVNETFSCIRTVISFAAQKQTINKFEKLSMDNNKLTESRLRSSTVYDSLTQILLTELIFTAALCYGIWRVADQSPGRLAANSLDQKGARSITRVDICVPGPSGYLATETCSDSEKVIRLSVKSGDNAFRQDGDCAGGKRATSPFMVVLFIYKSDPIE
ncbi:unnamed protein product [Heligmosomoides polygyrus]|uniref:ABC transmembrane type-1 domain-containing protein n=1 Tax=Heligmosomoides polygyrus TaxID=6339 RepID=A0A183F5P6_HELPZ|nr:unnamed protein product [Heligmosomoides polygyrus]